ETQMLYSELGKIGRPTDVFSTPTTKTHDNNDRAAKDKASNKGVPWNLPPFPEDYWFQVHEGETVAGFFRYKSGEDAVFIANHNAFAKQQVSFSLKAGAQDNSIRVDLLHRDTGQWVELKADKQRYAFELRPGGGELLRIKGRKTDGLPNKISK